MIYKEVFFVHLLCFLFKNTLQEVVGMDVRKKAEAHLKMGSIDRLHTMRSVSMVSSGICFHIK